jgi:cytochrome c oxidase subunit 1
VAHFHYVLSMGAVFALFSAFYYWMGKITGYQYPELWGKLHFWVLFIGVNLTFFPQHFLGLAGFPRRYADFPEGYADWNYVSSFGSIISAVAVFIFMYVLFRTFTDHIPVSANYWESREFFSAKTDPVSVPTLEWTQQSPPAIHTFNELPYLVESTK